MDSRIPDSPTKPGVPSWKEVGIFSLSLAALMALQIVLANAGSLFESHFWLDELFTFAIVADPDLPHALNGLANAVDTNPPTLHLLLRLWTSVMGSQSEIAFRLFAFSSMFLALIGVYLVLRDLFPSLPAAAGVLAVWCHPLILRHAFEARFYGPWLAGLVWYAYILSRSLRSPAHRGWIAALAAISVFVCTIHYFGILTLGLVTLFEMWAHRPWSRRLIPSVIALIFGPLALLACTPFYFGQRAALTVGTWVPAPDGIGALLGLAPLLVVFCLYYLRSVLQKHLPMDRNPSAVLGLLGLALLTPLLTLFSLTVQPATMARYILPSLAALAPVVAFLCLFLPRVGSVAVCLVLAIVSTFGLRDLADLYRQRDGRTNALAAAIRALPQDAPVAFEFTNALYVLDRYAPDLRPRLFFLEFERDEIEQASNHRIITRDVARQMTRFGDRHDLMSWTRFRSLPTKYVVPGEEPGEPLTNPDTRFPGLTLQPLQAGVYAVSDSTR